MLFEREDFYVGGVSVGGADLRFLVRPGDPISVQVGGYVPVFGRLSSYSLVSLVIPCFLFR